jgi:uncharacterized membrane protein
MIGKIFAAIGKILGALKAGEELADPAGWKNRATTANLLVVVLSAIAYLATMATGVQLPDDVIADVAQAVAITLGLVNAYIINATSKKVGFKKGEPQ